MLCQVPCVGVSIGIERVFSILEAREFQKKQVLLADCSVVTLDVRHSVALDLNQYE